MNKIYGVLADYGPVTGHNTPWLLGLLWLVHGGAVKV